MTNFSKIACQNRLMQFEAQNVFWTHYYQTYYFLLIINKLKICTDLSTVSASYIQTFDYCAADSRTAGDWGDTQGGCEGWKWHDSIKCRTCAGHEAVLQIMSPG